MRWGRDVWPPRPARCTVTRSAAAVIAPSRRPTLPTSRLGSQWTAKIASTSSRAPSASRSTAPPGMTSSAGWKSRRTPIPRSRSASSWALRASPAPSTPATWTSWPQAWQMPSVVDAQGSPVRSPTGRASRSARNATRYAGCSAPRSAISPLTGRVRVAIPAAVRRSATLAVVRVSPRESSGCACRSCCRARSSGARASMLVHRSASRWLSLMSAPTLLAAGRRSCRLRRPSLEGSATSLRGDPSKTGVRSEAGLAAGARTSRGGRRGPRRRAGRG